MEFKMTKTKQFLLATTSLKGGTGKSTFAGLLLSALRSRGVKIAGYDADGAIGTLSDMCAERDEAGDPLEEQDPLMGVSGYNIRDNSRDMFLNSLGASHQYILHDLAGGALADLKRICGDAESLDRLLRVLDRNNVQFLLFHVITPDVSTIDSVAQHLDLFDQSKELANFVQHVAVLNNQNNRVKDDFPIWFGYQDAAGETKGGNTRKRLLSLGGFEMNLPALSDRTMSLLKELHVSFHDAACAPRLSFVDQQRIQTFIEEFDVELNSGLAQHIGVST